MKRAATVVTLALAMAAILSAGDGPPPAQALVAKLRHQDTTFEDWRPILAAGEPAVPELKKLLSDPSDSVRASAAVLLYRLGEASALDRLGTLLESKDEAARKEAAVALLSFVGNPVDFDASAPADQRARAVGRWKAWWKQNRASALKNPPLDVLFARIVSADPATSLVAVSLSAKHAARRGMQLNVRRGKEFVCLIEVVMVDVNGSVARIVQLSARTPPKPGDLCFWKKH